MLLNRALANGYELPPDHPDRAENEFEAEPDAIPSTPPAILDPSDPYKSAGRFLKDEFTLDGFRTLYYQNGIFYAYNGTCYSPIGAEELRASLWTFCDSALRSHDSGGMLMSFKPTKASIDNILDAIRAIAFLPPGIEAPCWLDSRPDDPPADDLIPMANGILNVTSRRLLPRTPRLFSHHALAFEYSSPPARPERWFQYLRELCPEDQESIDTLQEIMGYLLVSDTSQQKIFLIVGPKRSGKGTLGRVIWKLLGDANVCAPTLGSLHGNFAMAPLIGKSAAIISDARLGGRADQAAIAERLLQVSGEDSVTIDRKYKAAWTGRLTTRFVILTNELPRIADASGALPLRFVLLQLDQSFYGREDPDLTAKLLLELPGILEWALEGLRRLRARGRFVLPTSSREAMQEIEDLASPVAIFARECCVPEPGRRVSVGELFSAWEKWCSRNGRKHPGTAQSFGRDLRAALPGRYICRKLRKEGGRENIYEGIGLKNDPVGDPLHDFTGDAESMNADLEE